jgi:hypothetical protein
MCNRQTGDFTTAESAAGLEMVSKSQILDLMLTGRALNAAMICRGAGHAEFPFGRAGRTATACAMEWTIAGGFNRYSGIGSYLQTEASILFMQAISIALLFWRSRNLTSAHASRPAPETKRIS